MDDTQKRLAGCFQVVFPGISEASIPAASQATIPEWDSVAAITMVSVIEDEFGVELDLEDLADLDSFEKIHAYIENRLRVA
jgi:acyl carrier protein